MSNEFKIRTLRINLAEWQEAMKITIDMGITVSDFVRRAVKKLIQDKKQLSKKDFQDKYLD